MGWLFEDRTELIPTGKVIAEERPAGGRLSELGKLLLIVAVVWAVGSAPSEGSASTSVPPQVSVESPAPSPSSSLSLP